MEQEKTSPWLIAFRVIFTIALIACIIFIFHNSLENATLSSARSQAVMQKLNAVLGRVGLGPLSEYTVRKLAHFCEYCLEGFLLMLCLRVYTKHFVRHMSWPLFGGLLTALTDETLQIVAAGRSSQVTDVWIDFSGVVAGFLVALLILLIFRAIGTVASVQAENRRLRKEHEELRCREAERQREEEAFRRGISEDDISKGEYL